MLLGAALPGIPLAQKAEQVCNSESGGYRVKVAAVNTFGAAVLSEGGGGRAAAQICCWAQLYPVSPSLRKLNKCAILS